MPFTPFTKLTPNGSYTYMLIVKYRTSRRHLRNQVWQFALHVQKSILVLTARKFYTKFPDQNALHRCISQSEVFIGQHQGSRELLRSHGTSQNTENGQRFPTSHQELLPIFIHATTSRLPQLGIASHHLLCCGFCTHPCSLHSSLQQHSEHSNPSTGACSAANSSLEHNSRKCPARLVNGVPACKFETSLLYKS